MHFIDLLLFSFASEPAGLPSRKRFRPFPIAAGLVAILVLAACEEPGTSLDDARALVQAGKYVASLEPLRELVDADPDNPEVNFLYGTALRQTGAPDMAIWALRKAAQSPEWRFAAGQELGAAALAGQEWDNAHQIANELLESAPDDIDALLIRAQAVLGRKSDPEAALADFEHIIDLDPNHVMAHSSRAAALISLGRVEDAADAMKELSEVAETAGVGDRMRGTICVSRALFANERGEAEESEALFADCAESFPNHATVIEEYAGYFDARGERERANEILLGALTARPNSSSIRMVLSRRYILKGDFEASETLLREGTALPNPRAKGDALLALADHYVAAGDLKAAADSFEESLTLIKGKPSQFQLLTFADVLARSGQRDRAREVAAEIENTVYRGLIESRLDYDEGEPAKALKTLDEILPLWPNNPGARYYAARSAEQLGDFPRAIEEYRQAVRSNAGFTEAGLRLGLIFEAMGDGNAAWAAVFPYAEQKPDDLEAVDLRVRLASRYGPDRKLKSLMQSLLRTPLRGRAVAARADFIAEVASPAAAVEAIREVKTLDLADPRNADALRSLLRHLVATKRFEPAVEIAKATLAADENVSDFHLAAGELAAAQGEAEAAKTAFARALELDETNAEADLGLGRVAASQGDPEAAIAAFKVARVKDIRLADAYLEAAELLQSAGRADEATEILEALLREMPHHAEAALRLTRQHLADGVHNDRTLELASRAVRFRGGRPALEMLADVHTKRGETAEAERVRAQLKKAAIKARSESPVVPGAASE
ncbi:MAG: tetratricopeptide repeat protein [Myxococcota bacterium]